MLCSAWCMSYLTHKEVEIMNSCALSVGKFVSEHPEKKVQNLARYLNEKNLKEAFKRLRSGSASGIDKMTKAEYAENLEENIRNLHNRLVHMTYMPRPSKRVYIPKPGTDKKRPLGIPAIEDKIVQYVIADVLNAIYEPLFVNESYGFRPHRSAHDAIVYLRNTITTRKVNYVVDADIRGFFDNIDHEWMIKFLEYRIEDKRFLEIIRRFLKAGIIENELFSETDKGSPQGGVVSPILANIYLHFVQDLWVEKIIKPRARGEVYYVRYADDSQVCFQYKDDAQEYYEGLKARLRKFGLEVAEEKTRVVRFGRFAKSDMRKEHKKGNPDVFNFLGFTFYCSETKSTHKFTVKIKTDAKKLHAKMKKASEWLRSVRHKPVGWIIDKINASLRGHYHYYGVSDNSNSMFKFRSHIIRMLYKNLKRRGNRHPLTWERFLKMLEYNPIMNPMIYLRLYHDAA